MVKIEIMPSSGLYVEGRVRSIASVIVWVSEGSVWGEVLMYKIRPHMGVNMKVLTMARDRLRVRIWVIWRGSITFGLTQSQGR